MKYLEQYNTMIRQINAMSMDEIDALIVKDQCPFHPELMEGLPLGQMHCPLCGDMCCAGVPHPRYSLLDDYEQNVQAQASQETQERNQDAELASGDV